MANSSVADWPSYIRKAFEFVPLPSYSLILPLPRPETLTFPSALSPQGYLELQEFHLATISPSPPPSSPSALLTSSSLISQSATLSSRPLIPLSTLPALLTQAGFKDVTIAFEGRWPSNSLWPESEKEKELGKWSHMNFVSGVGGFLRWFLPGLGWKEEEIGELVAEVVRELGDEGLKGFWPV